METESQNKLQEIAELTIDIKNEQNVKHNIVIPLLKCFGFNELTLEHASHGSRIDINIKNKIIIETKSYEKDIDDPAYIEQLKNYCEKEKPIIAIISNGDKFKIYSPFWRKRMSIFTETVIYYFERNQLTDINLITKLEKILSNESLQQNLIDEFVSEREEEIIKLFKLNEEKQIVKETEVKKLEDEVASIENEIKKLQESIIEKKQKIKETRKELENINFKLKKDNYLPIRNANFRVANENTIINDTPIKKIIEKDIDYVLEDRKKGLKAIGYYTDKGTFVVKENSTFATKIFPSLPDGASKKREYLIDNNILNLINDKYYLTVEHEFNTASQAAEVILGRSASGNVEFKQKIDNNFYDATDNGNNSFFQTQNESKRNRDHLQDYLLPTIKLIKSGINHTKVFHDIADGLNVTVQTAEDRCTRSIGLKMNEFLEKVKTNEIKEILMRKFSTKQDFIDKEL